MHKRAVRQRNLSDDNHSLANGIIIRTVSDNSIYDIIFFAREDDHFSRPNLSNTAEASENSTLQADLVTIEDFFEHFHDAIFFRMEEAVARLNSIKVGASLSLTIQKIEASGEIITSESSLRTNAQSFLSGDDFDEWFLQLVCIMGIKYEEMPERGSNWALLRVNDLELSISR